MLQESQPQEVKSNEAQDSSPWTLRRLRSHGAVVAAACTVETWMPDTERCTNTGPAKQYGLAVDDLLVEAKDLHLLRELGLATTVTCC